MFKSTLVTTPNFRGRGSTTKSRGAMMPLVSFSLKIKIPCGKADGCHSGRDEGRKVDCAELRSLRARQPQVGLGAKDGHQLPKHGEGAAQEVQRHEQGHQELDREGLGGLGLLGRAAVAITSVAEAHVDKEWRCH